MIKTGENSSLLELLLGKRSSKLLIMQSCVSIQIHKILYQSTISILRHCHALGTDYNRKFIVGIHRTGKRKRKRKSFLVVTSLGLSIAQVGSSIWCADWWSVVLYGGSLQFLV